MSVYRIWWQRAAGDYKRPWVDGCSYYVRGKENAEECYRAMCIWFVESEDDYIFDKIYEESFEEIVERYKIDLDGITAEDEKQMIMDILKKELHEDPVKFLKVYPECTNAEEERYIDAFIGVAMERVKSTKMDKFPFHWQPNN